MAPTSITDSEMEMILSLIRSDSMKKEISKLQLLTSSTDLMLTSQVGKNQNQVESLLLELTPDCILSQRMRGLGTLLAAMEYITVMDSEALVSNLCHFMGKLCTTIF